MEILSKQQLAERLNYVRPLKPEPEPAEESIWCIPFEHGDCPKGTRISLSKAREIAAQLRAEIAEAEKRELFRAFKREEERARESGRQSSEHQLECARLRGELEGLRQTIRRMRRGKRKA